MDCPEVADRGCGHSEAVEESVASARAASESTESGMIVADGEPLAC